MINQFCKVNLVPKALREVPTIDISQYDEELRTLTFVVYNGETLFEIPDGSTVTLRGTKPDNTGFEYECVYNGSIVTLDVKDQISVCAGRVICELRIVNEGILGTANVNIQVKRSALSSDVAISETDLPMVEIASQSYFLLDEANQAIESATQQAEALTEAIGEGLDYDNLTDKPSINGVTLSGNKTTQDLGISGGLIDVIEVNGTAQSIVNKTVDISVPTKTSDLTNDSGYLTNAVTSFNGNTGAVTYTAPVTSVNNQTGAVALNASDVGALADNTTYVSSVNGSSGAVTITVPTKTSDLNNDSGFLTSAVTTFNGQSGAVTYSAPVSSVNGQTGAVTGLQTTSNLVTSVSSSSTDSQYPSAKLLYDTVEDLQIKTEVVSKTSSDTSFTLQADKFYVWPEMSALSVTVTSTGMYAFRFTSGSTATTLTVTGATMPDSFTVEANKVYEINIYQGYGVASSWATS